MKLTGNDNLSHVIAAICRHPIWDANDSAASPVAYSPTRDSTVTGGAAASVGYSTSQLAADQALISAFAHCHLEDSDDGAPEGKQVSDSEESPARVEVPTPAKHTQAPGQPPSCTTLGLVNNSLGVTSKPTPAPKSPPSNSKKVAAEVNGFHPTPSDHLRSELEDDSKPQAKVNEYIDEGFPIQYDNLSDDDVKTPSTEVTNGGSDGDGNQGGNLGDNNAVTSSDGSTAVRDGADDEVNNDSDGDGTGDGVDEMVADADVTGATLNNGTPTTSPSHADAADEPMASGNNNAQSMENPTTPPTVNATLTGDVSSDGSSSPMAPSDGVTPPIVTDVTGLGDIQDMAGATTQSNAESTDNNGSGNEGSNSDGVTTNPNQDSQPKNPVEATGEANSTSGGNIGNMAGNAGTNSNIPNSGNSSDATPPTNSNGTGCQSGATGTVATGSGATLSTTTTTTVRTDNGTTSVTVTIQQSQQRRKKVTKALGGRALKISGVYHDRPGHKKSQREREYYCNGGIAETHTFLGIPINYSTGLAPTEPSKASKRRAPLTPVARDLLKEFVEQAQEDGMSTSEIVRAVRYSSKSVGNKRHRLDTDSEEA